MMRWKKLQRSQGAAVRKSKPKPALNFRLPDDLQMLVQARLYLRHPDEFDAEQFAKELAQFVVRHVKNRRLSGPEIAAMVDDRAPGSESISEAIDRVAEILGPTYSVEAVKKNHDRYGMRSTQIHSARSQMKEALEGVLSDLASAPLSELKDFEKTIEAIAAALKSHEGRISEFGRAKKDIIAQTVIEDD